MSCCSSEVRLNCNIFRNGAGYRMKRRLEQRTENFKEVNLRILRRIEQYLSLSTLSEKEQESCLEEVIGRIEEAEVSGGTYRSFTGNNLQKYCRELIAAHGPKVRFREFGMLVLQVQILALITGLAIAVMESAVWTHTSFWTQEISICLVYGMAVAERIIDRSVRIFAGKSLLRGYSFFYEKLPFLEWMILIAGYILLSVLVYITPLYQQVTYLKDMACLLLAAFCTYGFCILAERKTPVWQHWAEQWKTSVKKTGNASKSFVIGIGICGVITAVLFCVCYVYLKQGAGWLSSGAVLILMILTVSVWSMRDLFTVKNSF